MQLHKAYGAGRPTGPRHTGERGDGTAPNDLAQLLHRPKHLTRRVKHREGNAPRMRGWDAGASVRQLSSEDSPAPVCVRTATTLHQFSKLLKTPADRWSASCGWAVCKHYSPYACIDSGTGGHWGQLASSSPTWWLGGDAHPTLVKTDAKRFFFIICLQCSIVSF